MCWFLHINRRWGHVSLALLGLNVQLGLGKLIMWLPIDCMYQYFRVCMI